jgi:hypothetical protein
MKSSLIISLVAVIFVCCSKKTVNQTGSGDLFIGNWLFNVHRYEVNTDSIGFYSHDSITYLGNIKYITIPNLIQVNYTQQDSIVLVVDSLGLLSNFPTPYCSGQIYPNDSIYIYLKWGGLGGGTTHIINGNKVLN